MSFRLTHGSRALAAGVAAIALIAAGCGGSDDETTAGEPAAASTKDEFIAQVDQICTDTGTETNAAVQELGTAPTEDDLVAFFEDVTIPALAAQFEEIDALTPPEGQEDEVQAMVDAGNEAVAESEKDPTLLLVFSGAPTPFDEFSQLAQDYGLQVCGGGEPDAGKPVG